MQISGFCAINIGCRVLKRISFSGIFRQFCRKDKDLTKKRKEKPRREFTKRQLSQWQRHKRRQRIIFGLGVFIIVVVLSVIGVGWYTSQYQPLHQTVISVNDTKFNMDYYIKMLKFYGKGQAVYYVYSLPNRVVGIIEQNELIRQGALELGISISRDEVDDELKSRDSTLSKDYRDLVRAEMLVDKLLDEYFDQQVPKYAEQRYILAMLLESESQADEVRLRLESGEDFAELAGELSLESLSKEENGDLGWRPEGVLPLMLGTSVFDEYVFNSDVGVLSQPLYDGEVIKDTGYWIIKVLGRGDDLESADIQVMLLGSEEEAQKVRDRLEAGEDFGTLAKDLSQHDMSKEDGGEVNDVTPDMLSLEFSEFVFDPTVELETVSEPIRDDAVITNGGYWLIKVQDKDENRQIEESDRDLLKADTLDKWIDALWDDPKNKIESYLDDEQIAWALEKAMSD